MKSRTQSANSAQFVNRGVEAVMNELRSSPHYQIINNAIAEMEWWACFDESPDSDMYDEVLDLDKLDDFGRPKLAPVRSQKVGRNAPCPCGSGKKYKYCCGRA